MKISYWWIGQVSSVFTLQMVSALMLFSRETTVIVSSSAYESHSDSYKMKNFHYGQSRIMDEFFEITGRNRGGIRLHTRFTSDFSSSIVPGSFNSYSTAWKNAWQDSHSTSCFTRPVILLSIKTVKRGQSSEISLFCSQSNNWMIFFW